MNAFVKTSLAALALVTALVSCAGQAQIQSNVGFSRDATPGGSAMPTNGTFPAQCFVDGKLAIKEEPACYGTGANRYCSEYSVLCSCVGTDSVASWARLKSVDNGNPQYGYCSYAPPAATQVDVKKIGQAASSTAPVQSAPPPPPPPAASASASASSVGSGVGPVASAPPVDPKPLQASPSCETKDGVVTCRTITASADDADAGPQFHCVGPNVVPLGINDLAKYAGGPPCTCGKGKLKKIASAQNTWLCDTTGK